MSVLNGPSVILDPFSSRLLWSTAWTGLGGYEILEKQRAPRFLLQSSEWKPQPEDNLRRWSGGQRPGKNGEVCCREVVIELGGAADWMQIAP